MQINKRLKPKGPKPNIAPAPQKSKKIEKIIIIMKQQPYDENKHLEKPEKLNEDNDLRESIIPKYDANEDLNKKTGSLNESKPKKFTDDYDVNKEMLTE